jgi:hypothetical protein
MSQSAAEQRSSRQVPRRYGILIGAAVAAGLLTGGVAATFGPAMVSSTARVGLPLTSLTPADSVAIAESNIVMSNALNPGMSLGTARGDIQVTGSTSGFLSVTARATRSPRVTSATQVPWASRPGTYQRSWFRRPRARPE